jgi:ssDNA-binding Zn-finger/Zn-ribbon topoisomerase 1
MERLGAAVQALPRAIPLRTTGHIECPNCGGVLMYSRWHRGAEIACSTENCCGARFNIAAGAEWPARQDGAA